MTHAEAFDEWLLSPAAEEVFEFAAENGTYGGIIVAMQAAFIAACVISGRRSD